MEKKKKLQYILIAFLVIVGIITFGYFFLFNLKNKNNSQEITSDLKIKKSVQTNTVRMYNQNKLNDLIVNLLSKLKANPNDTNTLVVLANVYLQQGNINYQGKKAIVQARVYLQKVLSKNPRNVRANLLLGYSYELEGDIDRAIEIYTKIITELDKSYAYAYSKLGHAYEMKGNYVLAVNNYKKALKLNKNSSDVYIDLAGLLARAGEGNKAMGYYQKALTLTNNNEQKSGIYATIGSIYSNSKRTIKNKQKAVEMFKKAIQLNPKNSLAFANLEKEYFTRLAEDKETDKLMDDSKKIEYYYNKAVTINPNESIIYQWYGLTMFFLNKENEAIKFFNTGIKMVDNDARLFGNEKNKQKAKFYMLKSIVYAQNSNPATIKLSIKYLKMAINLNKNLLKDIVLTNLNKDSNGYFSKIKDNIEFKKIISNH